MRTTAYLSLGSNLEDRVRNLVQAISQLSQTGEVAAQSPFYETEPIDVVAQPWFVNCAIALTTELTAPELLTTALAIEKEMGRLRSRAKGPRIIDIDIVLYGDFVVQTPELTIPHPAMHQRRFVLGPLADIAPEVVHPSLHRTVRELLAELPAGQVVRKI